MDQYWKGNHKKIIKFSKKRTVKEHDKYFCRLTISLLI